MKDRIAHIMRAKNLKASDFATLLGIQPSGISHILSGRNQPSLEFVKKIKETFPEYNLDWIIFGTGPVTTSEPFQSKPMDNPIVFDVPNEPLDDPSVDSPAIPLSLSSNEPPALGSPSPAKSLLILYEDGTFETFRPR